MTRYSEVSAPSLIREFELVCRMKCEPLVAPSPSQAVDQLKRNFNLSRRIDTIVKGYRMPANESGVERADEVGGRRLISLGGGNRGTMLWGFQEGAEFGWVRWVLRFR